METKSLRWLFRNTFHVGDRGLRSRTRYFSTVDLATVDAQLPQFPDDPWRAPGGIRLGHLADQLTDLLDNGGATDFATLTQPSPVVAKPPVLARDHGAWLDEGEHLLPFRPQAREPGPQQPIGRVEPWAGNCLFIDRDLML
jgi:hypothetical protein